MQQWSDTVRKEMEKLVSEGVNSFIVNVEGDDILYQVSVEANSNAPLFFFFFW